MPEFNRRTLESLREPLETGRVLISRAMRTARFPARFQLVAAMNPCPCGWRGHPARACACTPDQVARYAGRVSGPCWTASTCICACRRWPGRPGRAAGEASPAVRERVLACRGRQLERQDKPNAALAGAELDRHCALDESGRELLRQAMRRLRGSARVLHRTLRVARTIADLEGAERLGARHVAQAVQYRAE